MDILEETESPDRPHRTSAAEIVTTAVGAAAEPLPEVRITRRAADYLRAGHVWVYRTEIESAASTASLAPGALVTVRAGTGPVLGVGTWSSSSTLAVRLFTRGPAVPIPDRPAFLALVRDRIRAAIALRDELAPITPESNARRLLFSEADALPGLIADQYGDLVILQLLTQGTSQDDLRRAVAEELADALANPAAPLTLWERPDPRVRELEQLAPAPTGPLLTRGGEPRSATTFHLNGLAFHFDAAAGQKTGAFLDQRLNYAAAAHALAAAAPAARRRALDICTYQGGFALHLARVADRVTGVDTSRSALEVADRNLQQNASQIRAEVGWIEADAFDLLRAWDDANERFGAIVLDPPAFAKSKRALEGALRGYKELNLRALRMIEPGGILVTCSCSHHVSEAAFRETLASAAADAGRTVQILETRGAAPDHPEIATLPETRYLKCLLCRVS